jgi:hypothetical protein
MSTKMSSRNFSKRPFFLAYPKRKKRHLTSQCTPNCLLCLPGCIIHHPFTRMASPYKNNLKKNTNYSSHLALIFVVLHPKDPLQHRRCSFGCIPTDASLRLWHCSIFGVEKQERRNQRKCNRRLEECIALLASPEGNPFCCFAAKEEHAQT